MIDPNSTRQDETDRLWDEALEESVTEEAWLEREQSGQSDDDDEDT